MTNHNIHHLKALSRLKRVPGEAERLAMTTCIRAVKQLAIHYFGRGNGCLGIVWPFWFYEKVHQMGPFGKMKWMTKFYNYYYLLEIIENKSWVICTLLPLHMSDNWSIYLIWKSSRYCYSVVNLFQENFHHKSFFPCVGWQSSFDSIIALTVPTRNRADWKRVVVYDK